MTKTFLTTTIVFYVLAFISASVAISYANDSSVSYTIMHATGVDSASDGAAVAFGIIASSFIIVGSFFLYKYLTSKPNA